MRNCIAIGHFGNFWPVSFHAQDMIINHRFGDERPQQFEEHSDAKTEEADQDALFIAAGVQEKPFLRRLFFHPPITSISSICCSSYCFLYQPPFANSCSWVPRSTMSPFSKTMI